MLESGLICKKARKAFENIDSIFRHYEMLNGMKENKDLEGVEMEEGGRYCPTSIRLKKLDIC